MNNVLIVDQSEILRLQVRSIISSPKINVLETAKVEEVKNNSFAADYSLHDIDLLIFDIQFGEKQDFSLLDYLQKTNLKVPVLILSSNDRRETVLKAYRLGAQDYLLKPFEEHVLKAKVNYYLDNKGDKWNVNSDKNSIVDYFAFDLLQELSRSLRGDSIFTIVKFEVAQDEKNSITKNLLLSLMRGIDRIYKISETELLLFLPLTDKKGSKVLLQRINDYLAEHIEKKEVNLDRLLSFPEDITDEVEQNKVVSYQHQIVNELFRN
ncbi:response regulator [Halanaerobacter jeridensis]|uniref:Stage 0 sporulation protein A homolog n=1 Tax=Halanaerobacter jeridensis TaxID=706427 RepID=A0A938XRF5_9FIRM|nr:DNA-binding response OmpR family regulator [Halanaerobacter jeridensis]